MLCLNLSFGESSWSWLALYQVSWHLLEPMTNTGNTQKQDIHSRQVTSLSQGTHTIPSHTSRVSNQLEHTCLGNWKTQGKPTQTQGNYQTISLTWEWNQRIMHAYCMEKVIQWSTLLNQTGRSQVWLLARVFSLFLDGIGGWNIQNIKHSDPARSEEWGGELCSSRGQRAAEPPPHNNLRIGLLIWWLYAV